MSPVRFYWEKTLGTHTLFPLDFVLCTFPFTDFYSVSCHSHMLSSVSPSSKPLNLRVILEGFCHNFAFGILKKNILFSVHYLVLIMI